MPSHTSSYRSSPVSARSALSRSSTYESRTIIAIAVLPSLRQLQFLRPHDHDREWPGLVRLQVLVHLLHRHRVDGVLDLVEGADAAANEEVVGDGAGAG